MPRTFFGKSNLVQLFQLLIRAINLYYVLFTTTALEADSISQYPCPLVGTLLTWTRLSDVLAFGMFCPQTRRRRTLEPVAAMTSKQLRVEILPIYYAENTFTSHDQRSAMLPRTVPVNWLTSIGKHARHITKVRFTIKMSHRDDQGVNLRLRLFRRLRLDWSIGATVIVQITTLSTSR